MSGPSSKLPNDLAPLIEQLINGQISDRDFDRLNTILAESAQARRLYRRYMNLHTALSCDLGSVPQIPTDMPALNGEESKAAEALAELYRQHMEGLDQPIDLEAHRRKSREHSVDHVSRATKLRARLIIGGSLAAVIALAGLLVGVISLLTGPSTPDEQLVDADRRVVATLTNERDAQWLDDAGESVELAIGDGLLNATVLTLAEGFAEVTTSRGAVAVIDAPATIELLNSDNALHLHAGKLVGICETETSKGFLVRTPHMAITDLGTRFGIDADADATEVHVFEGEVQALAADADEAEVPTLLLAGESASISSTLGQVVKIQHESEAFAMLLPETIQLPGTGFGLKTGEADPSWQVVAIDGKRLDRPHALAVSDHPEHTRAHARREFQSHWLAWNEGPREALVRRYTIRARLKLPQDFAPERSVLGIRCMADNRLDALRANGQPVPVPERIDPEGLGIGYPYHVTVAGGLLVPGDNTFEFEVTDIQLIVGLCVDWELRDTRLFDAAQP